LVLAILPVVIVFAMGAGTVIIDLVGFCYPVYASIKVTYTNLAIDKHLFKINKSYLGH
jgi:hypothetical protein